jgi:16S rRNA (cytosine1402-N4)-methyltransferase
MDACTTSLPVSKNPCVHIPVLLEEVLAFITPLKPERILDCTFGGGGHSRALLEHSNATLWAVDRDPDAGARAASLKQTYGDRFHLTHANYDAIDSLQVGNLDAILFDLGISSFHVDEAGRGFSFMKDAPLDMRMDPTRGMSAAAFLETAPMDALIRAVREYGEEKNWKSIVKVLMEARGTDALSRTVSLAQLIESVTPARERRLRKGHHPATQTFQGLRMEVNRELDHLAAALPKAFSMLREGGRLLVISFHSLEDRLVKKRFREWAGFPVDASDSTPRQDRSIVAQLLTRKPIRPSEAEVQRNPRSRSALLRVIEKDSFAQKGGRA